VFLYSKIEVLEVIDDDDEVKFEEKKYVKELQVNFIESEGIKLNMEFFLACAYHKLNFEVHQYKLLFENVGYNAIFEIFIHLKWKSLILDR
jgi:hypothetical protein